MIDWFALELPKPPSVNRLTSKLGNRSPIVQKWWKAADSYVMGKRYPRIQSWYEMLLELPRAERGKYDLSNRIKVLEDYLERIELIKNDKMAEDIHLRWGDVPKGFCRVSVRPWVET